jgi:hypothetical protein
VASENDDLGARGEDAISTCLRRPLSATQKPQFRPKRLGEKAELLDFVVFLVDDNGKQLGSHFFLQVKTTRDVDANSTAASFSADEVRRAQALKTPAYLAAVDASRPDKEAVCVLGIGTSRLKGYASIPKRLSLDDTKVRNALYDEVKAHFDSRVFTFDSKVK